MKRTYTQRKIRESLPVMRALELGWSPFLSNKTAHKYFRFIGPVRFDVSITPQGSLSFTVGDTTTSYVPQVLKMLESVPHSGGR
jgi:hypothetical protein